jgi:hypothetical protein
MSGWVAFRLAWNLTSPAQSDPVRGLCALGGVLAATVGATWQSAGTAVGGPAFGTLLLLSWWLWCTQRSASRAWPGHGVFLGLLLLETPAAALVGALGVGLAAALQLRLPSPRELAHALAAVLVVVSVGLLPSLLQSGASGYGALGLELLLPARSEQLGLGLPTELGLYLGALGLFGAALPIRERLRRSGAILALAWAGFGCVFAVPAVQLGAVTALGALAGSGLCELLGVLRRMNAPLLGAAGRALGLLHLGAILLIGEGASYQGHSGRAVATRQWSEEAFERLPPRALLLVSSPEAAWRLWAARLTSGVRPDVVLVPSALLAEAGQTARLLAFEPKLAPLIRDEAAQGVPSELSLTQLADARPLRVEVDADWGKNLLRHLEADGLWFKFAPHAPGRTDRIESLPSAFSAFRRVVRAARDGTVVDQRTLDRAGEDLVRHAAVAAALGDRSSAERVLRQLKRAGLSSPSALAVRSWLGDGNQRPATLEQALFDSDTSSP